MDVSPNSYDDDEYCEDQLNGDGYHEESYLSSGSGLCSEGREKALAMVEEDATAATT